MQIAYNTISDLFVFFIQAKILNYFMLCKFSFKLSARCKYISIYSLHITSFFREPVSSWASIVLVFSYYKGLDAFFLSYDSD